MNNILVTGSNGQLGSEIRALHVEYSDSFFFSDRDELDITCKDSINSFIEKNRINVIVNCAAYTAVDSAEEDRDSAYAVNSNAVKNLAQIAKDKEIKLLHVSTDYVFDGKNYKPYIESDETAPNGVYGASKLEGEMAMQSINPKHSIIIRTSWVYSSFGANFVKTMLKLGKDRDELGVIYDQVGTPTYARDLARAILDIVPKINSSKVEIYHYSNEGVLSWYDFAKEIMKMSSTTCKVNPIETYQYPTPATRPYYSLLNKAKVKKEFDIEIPYWKDSLSDCLKILGERK
ncbi:MAG: dTDP-4-dehydrorhamnose reductase [Campylobacterota bacterium]|nr:dTDP-4-dehydrorhamnose reductase [Campylobacterota bacterium]